MPRKDFYEPFFMMNKISGTDALGQPNWYLEQGAPFRAGIYPVRSDEALIAGRVGNKSIFVIQTDAELLLEQNDYVYRVKDQRTYRITGNSVDKITPAVSGDQYAEVTAEVVT